MFVRYLMESFCDLNIKCVILAGVILAPAVYILPESSGSLVGTARVCEPGQRIRYSNASNPGRGRNFPLPARTALGLTSLLDNGEPVSFPGIKRPGRGVDPPPHLVSSLKKE